MRTITYGELKDILAKHKKWLNDERGGKKANLRYADLRYADLKFADLRGADLKFAILQEANLRYARRPWLVIVDHIGSRKADTIYLADIDNVWCGCWNEYSGGTLAEFKIRVDKVYPADSKNEVYQRYRTEYLSAIKMFESMRGAYLDEISL